MEKVRYHEMLPHEILERRSKCPAAFVGLGMLEWHGQHLAMGNDALKAEKLCELAAERSGGFAFPTLWYGEPLIIHNSNGENDFDGRIKPAMRWKPGKFTYQHTGAEGQEEIDLYKRLLHHVLVQMNLIEMRAVVLVCGHYPLINYATPVVMAFNSRYPDTQAFAGIEFQFSPEERIDGAQAGGDHAAKWETSYLMHLRPDCVDLSIYLDGTAGEPIGIHGKDPRSEASRSIGRRASDLIVEGMVRKARELISECRSDC